MSDDARRPAPPPGTLKIFRLAFLAGVLILGAVGGFLASGDVAPTLDDDTGELLTYVFFAFALGILGLLQFFRRLRARSETPGERFTFALVGYALADGVAIFGFVFILLTGSFLPYLTGVLVLLLAFVMFPPEVPGRTP